VSNRSRYLVSALLVVLAAIWFRVNSPVEGPTLIVFTADHGLTVADLLSVAMVLAAGWLLWTTRRDAAAATDGPGREER